MPNLALFDTVPDDVLAFGRGTGFNPKMVADWMSLDNADVSRISAVSRKSVRYDQNMPKAVGERLEEIAQVANMVARIFNGDAVKTAQWFKTKNPMLGDVSPRDMVRLGRYDRLRKYIITAIADNSSPAR